MSTLGLDFLKIAIAPAKLPTMPYGKSTFPSYLTIAPHLQPLVRPGLNVAASEATPDGAEDLTFPDNQEDVEQSDEYTDDEYFAMMVAQGHFDTEVEDSSNINVADNK